MSMLLIACLLSFWTDYQKTKLNKQYEQQIELQRQQWAEQNQVRQNQLALYEEMNRTYEQRIKTIEGFTDLVADQLPGLTN